MAELTPDEMRTLLRKHLGWKLPKSKYDDLAIRRMYHRYKDGLKPKASNLVLVPLYLYRDRDGYEQMVVEYQPRR